MIDKNYFFGVNMTSFILYFYSGFRMVAEIAVETEKVIL